MHFNIKGIPFIDILVLVNTALEGKVINVWGLLYVISTMTTALVTLPFMFVLSFLSDIFGDRKVLDELLYKFFMLN